MNRRWVPSVPGGRRIEAVEDTASVGTREASEGREDICVDDGM